MKKGRLVTLSGISGSGKSYLVKDLLKSDLGFEHLLSATTRQKRDNETSGVEAHFLTMDDFRYLEKNNEFLTVDNVFGNLYGLLRSDFDNYRKA